MRRFPTGFDINEVFIVHVYAPVPILSLPVFLFQGADSRAHTLLYQEEAQMGALTSRTFSMVVEVTRAHSWA